MSEVTIGETISPNRCGSWKRRKFCGAGLVDLINICISMLWLVYTFMSFMISSAKDSREVVTIRGIRNTLNFQFPIFPEFSIIFSPNRLE